MVRGRRIVLVLVVVLVLEGEQGRRGTPTLQSNPTCSTYLHIAVERLFEDEDDDEGRVRLQPYFEAFCGPQNLLT